ncbi:efflux RND transporter periplasmic adaptor subunit [Fodinibius sp. SL11]|uniref:efflux RND transporter periplasmic adaptor subunit n=1 Tax=Fodinibius sp. SL11 TaxID=3425690 RepID=UPI003F885A6E
MAEQKTGQSTTENIEQTLGIEGDAGKKRKRVFYGLLVVVLLLSGWWGWKYLSATEPFNYVTGEVSRGNLTILISATGDLQAVNTVEVGSEISGLIEEVFVDYNDRVTAGQLLARIDTDRLEAEVAQAEASLESSQAMLSESIAGLEEQRSITGRARRLAEQDLISDQELENQQTALTRAEAAVASARAQIVVNEANLNMARTNLSKASILSPIDGVVLTSDIKSGQAVAASFQTPVLFTLAEDLTQMELHADIDEADIGRISEGQQAKFTVDAYPDSTFSATLTKVHYAPQTSSGVVTYEAILTVDNSDMLLWLGMTATTEIVTQQVEDALMVPNSALRFTPPESTDLTEGDVVWVLDDNKPKAIPVTTGVSDGRSTQILKGDLEPGQQLLINIRIEE